MANIYDNGTYGFPDQNAPDEVKDSKKYGNQVANFISNQWFFKETGSARFYDNREEMERLRLYARGAQNTSKYKRELSVDGDLSYLNLDWEPVPVIPKFVDLVVNGIQDRLWDVIAYAQDHVATDKRRHDLKVLQGEMEKKSELLAIQAQTGVKVFENDIESLPKNNDELEVFSQLHYKQEIEIAAETAISQIFEQNRYEEVSRDLAKDLTELGIAAAKHSFDPSKGVCVQYVDPQDIIYTYTNNENFNDIHYHGEIKRIGMHELIQMFPDLPQDTIKKIRQAGANHFDYHGIGYEQVQSEQDELREANKVEIMFFSWKTIRRDVHKIRETRTGGKSAIKKSSEFEGPKTPDAKFTKAERLEEVIYSGIKVLGDDDLLLKWEIEKNMVRPKYSTAEVVMPMIIVAPNQHRGRFDSLVKRVTKWADLIQLTHMKIQQVLQKVVPPGVGINADAIAEIDLGNGTSYDPREALNMFFQTGSVIYRTQDAEGAPLGNQLPINELPGSQGQQLQMLIQNQEYYYSMIRRDTGINEARDASDPDPRALVGVQKLLAANSNTATRHILDGKLNITKKLAEAVILRMQDVLEFHPLKENFKMSIGKINTMVLDHLDNLHLHDFGISLKLEPDEEAKQFLEQNIQQALQQGQIHLDDAIDVREIKNIKLANQVLKLRRKRKFEEDLAIQQEQAKAQGEAQAQVVQQSEAAKQQTMQMEAELEAQKKQIERENRIAELQAEKEFEMEILAYKHSLQMQILGAEQKHSTQENDKANRSAEKIKGGGAGTGGIGINSKTNTVDGKIKGAGSLQDI